MIALFRSATVYCHPEKYIHEWWVVEAELLPPKNGFLNPDDSAVVVDGVIPMFDVGDGKPEKLVLFNLLNLETMEWLKPTYHDRHNAPPDWIKDPLLVAMKVAEVRDI